MGDIKLIDGLSGRSILQYRARPLVNMGDVPMREFVGVGHEDLGGPTGGIYRCDDDGVHHGALHRAGKLDALGPVVDDAIETGGRLRRDIVGIDDDAGSGIDRLCLLDGIGRRRGPNGHRRQKQREAVSALIDEVGHRLLLARVEIEDTAKAALNEPVGQLCWRSGGDGWRA